MNTAGGGSLKNCLTVPLILTILWQCHWPEPKYDEWRRWRHKHNSGDKTIVWQCHWLNDCLTVPRIKTKGGIEYDEAGMMTWSNDKDLMTGEIGLGKLKWDQLSWMCSVLSDQVESFLPTHERLTFLKVTQSLPHPIWF